MLPTSCSPRFRTRYVHQFVLSVARPHFDRLRSQDHRQRHRPGGPFLRLRDRRAGERACHRVCAHRGDELSVRRGHREADGSRGGIHRRCVRRAALTHSVRNPRQSRRGLLPHPRSGHRPVRRRVRRAALRASLRGEEGSLRDRHFRGHHHPWTEGRRGSCEGG